ncbi:MAG TPA: hypothetical protein VFE58_11800 [Tepidisphaeraceae bacterium]|nr:hypothetical protein [Tepidisphaeraceae bacterium]
MYQQVIPASERKSILKLGAMLSRRDYCLIGAQDEEGRIIAFAVMFMGKGVRLLEYLGVEGSRQKRGIGREVFQYCATIGEGPMVIEVEREDLAGVDQVVRAGRVEFYRRLGCRRIEGLEYQLPLLGEVPPMRLFVQGVGGRESLGLEEVRGYLRTIYREVYGQSEDDPRIEEMLRGVKNPVLLG